MSDRGAVADLVAVAEVLPSTALAAGLQGRVALAERTALRLYALPGADGPLDGPDGTPDADVASALDDRLRRREHLLHHLALERQRQRRRRTA